MLAEHEPENERGDLVQERDHPNREQRCVRPVAPRGLAVAPSPITGEGQQQRGKAERSEDASVCEQPRTESGHRAECRATQQSDTNDGDEQQIRTTGEDLDARNDRELNDDDEEQQSRCLGDVRPHHGAFGLFFWVTRAVTASSEEKSTNGLISTCLYGAVSLWPTCVTTPIGIPRGNSDGY